MPSSQNNLIQVNGQKRLFDVYTPTSEKKGWPVVISLHGGGGNPSVNRRQSRLNEAAERAGFATVMPHGTGTGGLLTWNSGTCCGPAYDNDVDDVAFLSALIDRLRINDYVDPYRIFVMGFSNGAAMAYRLLAAASDRIAGVCAIGSTAQVTMAGIRRPTPVMHIHGMQDTHAPWHGGVGPDAVSPITHRSALDVAAEIAQANGFSGCPLVDGGPRWLRVMHNGPAPVITYLLPGGGHTYPGGVDVRGGKDGPIVDWPANDVALMFFGSLGK